MIDFPSTFTKLVEIEVDDVKERIAGLMLEGEKVIAAFKNSYDDDTVVFTDKRVLLRETGGLVALKTDITSLPYSKIQAFSVEASGALDSDGEMVLSFLGLGQVKLGFKGHADVAMLSRMIGGFAL